MARRGRFIIDAGIGVALVGSIAALGIAGPASPAPAAAPRDTFTHVDAIVDDSGVHLQPAHVPAGQVEFTLVDRRSAAGGALGLHSTPSGIDVGANPSVVPVRTLGDYMLRVDGARASASAVLKVEVPALGSPREPAHQLTVVVDDHAMTTPRREARFEEPLVAPATTPGPEVPWTTVAQGNATILFENHSRVAQNCSVDGGAPVAVRAHASGHITATVGSRTSELSCVGAGSMARRFDVWPG